MSHYQRIQRKKYGIRFPFPSKPGSNHATKHGALARYLALCQQEASGAFASCMKEYSNVQSR